MSPLLHCISRAAILALVLSSASLPDAVQGFTTSSTIRSRASSHARAALPLSMSTTSRDDASFAAFADSLEEDNSKGATTSSSRTSKQQSSSKSNSTSNNKSNSNDSLEDQSWQVCVEELLDPATPLPRRQALLAKLVNSNKDIQESVLTALRDRKIDGLLTPTGKKLQDGTQTVARQLANDILPNLAKQAGPPRPENLLPNPDEVSKVGSRILNALNNQVQRNLEVLQGDLANPVRIPQRISRQTNDLVTEARNVFSETPVGLKEPAYTVVEKTDSYEIRDYQGYSVASTSMGRGSVILEGGERLDSGTNLAETGAAFNTLAAYLFGANKQGESMEMTTPVTTTSWGEMRFYLSNRDDIPDPLDDVSSGSLYETGAVTILDIPPARLAVRKFTGFVTEGEIARQKDALLSALMMDDVELDVAHGDPISHVIFQYNPPYTLPIVRRNEIAVAVRRDEDFAADLQQQWVEDDSPQEQPEASAETSAPNNKKSDNSVNGERAAVMGEDDVSPSD